MPRPCSRGRLLKVGGGRYANKYSHGSPIKSITNARTAKNETDSDASLDYDDGTLDPNLWADDWDNHTQNSYVKRRLMKHHLGTYDISDSDSDSEGVEGLPLVSDMIMRPYRVTQSIHANSVRDADLMDVVLGKEADIAEINHLLGNNKQFLDSRNVSNKKVDFHGRKIHYSPHGNDFNGSYQVGKFITMTRNLLLSRNNLKNMSEQEQIAIARGHFTLMVIRNWGKYAKKSSRFRRIMLRFFCGLALKDWAAVTAFLRKGELFVGKILKTVYGQSFRKWNAHRLGSKAAQLMQLCAGNHLRVMFRSWKKYNDMRHDQNALAGIFGEKQLMKRCMKRWVFRMGVGKLFARCAVRLRFRAQATYFDYWRYMTEWLKFVESYWGTAVERATKHAYMRWAGKRWLDNVNRRKMLRLLLLKVLKSAEKGLLSWAFYKLKFGAEGGQVKRRPKRGPRKPGFCRCVYALCHGGHCECSWEVHFLKRIKNFDGLATSTEKQAYKRDRLASVFEKDYAAGLCSEVNASYDGGGLGNNRGNTHESIDSGRRAGAGFGASPARWDENGRRIRSTPAKRITIKSSSAVKRSGHKNNYNPTSKTKIINEDDVQPQREHLVATTLESLHKMLESNFGEDKDRSKDNVTGEIVPPTKTVKIN